MSGACLILLVAGVIDAKQAGGQPRPGSASTSPHTAPHLSAPIRYARRGLPVRRVGAGVRGYTPVPLAARLVAVVAPRDHVALTLTAQPTLYWLYRAPARDSGVIATLILRSGGSADSMRITPGPGVLQRVDLADVGTRLRPETDYRWTVRVGPSDAPSQASDEAWIRLRVPRAASRAVRRAIADPSTVESARALAAAGYWYDACAALLSARAAAPDDAQLDRLWREFIRQTVPGLDDAPR